ncbi:tryptophanyl-tRNA synthetase [Petrocella atlantisensis]|uniref:Tryptophan--tRNA ligase n=1 Tax=Petrocella atlantisensis TaxID=2173034 RepID=A0A3P7NUF6_9FIRM|nr:tryptophan--tRNA ligase [Petrocella atlantisensis]PKM56297.1 MAG: tryptophan--tRNA ligase [Firmicutes bacterium HGW-Firmicutes-5]VDN46505.1 tryptophanyl-tRNA synthetase [Petrocella atlantisensis]
MNEQAQQKKVIFSGMQPTGVITIGNYFGALKNWVKLHNEYNCLFCVVDMHSITTRQDPVKLRKSARELLALYIAAGLDPDENLIYYQSHVPEHAELSWILSCFTYMGELNRMTQFKEKSQKSELNLNAGLYTYPILMAADILLFKTDLVPVGNDQKQHLELARDIASRFNGIYGDTFTVPEPYIAKMGARIASLQEPTKKMSKSDENPNAYISLLDEPSVIRKKIKKAVTDSDALIAYTEEKAGIRNLIDIYCLSKDITTDEALEHFQGKGYGELKEQVADALIAELEPIQKRFKEILSDKAYLDGIILKNAESASRLAERVLRKVKKKVGYPQ